jgi:hypothetical protein
VEVKKTIAALGASIASVASPLLKQYMRVGRLERKASCGVYDYSQYDAQHAKP